MIAAICMAALSSCASKRNETSPDLGVGFKPIQLHWSAAEGVDPDEEFPGKDACVIRITGSVMSAAEVQASPQQELEYLATYAPDANRPGTFVFKGVCAGTADKSAKECVWDATCDELGKVVVNFHNEL